MNQISGLVCTCSIDQPTGLYALWGYGLMVGQCGGAGLTARLLAAGRVILPTSYYLIDQCTASQGCSTIPPDCPQLLTDRVD